MITQALSQGWTLQSPRWPQEIPAQAPGSIYSALLRAGLGPAPYWRDNHLEIRRLLDQSFTYACRFQPDPALLDCEYVNLHLDSVDGEAVLSLNGSPLGRAANPYRAHDFPVGHLLRPGENRLTAVFSPPAGSRAARFIPDGGLLGPVQLQSTGGKSDVKLDHVRISHTCQDGRTVLQVGFGAQGSLEGVRFIATLATPQGEVLRIFHRPYRFVLEDPQPWWPRGYGEH